jgi:uncharacterized damage-inducible protein DinB
MHPKTLTYQFGLCTYALDRNLGQLSEEETLISPWNGGNCINWVLGHITSIRNQALRLFGQKPLFPYEDFRAYEGEEDVPFRSENALPFDELKRRFKALQEPWVKGLNEISEEAMSKPAPLSPTNNPNETVGSLLAALAFHEAYHVGQTGMLRRVVGREGVIKPPRVPV